MILGLFISAIVLVVLLWLTVMYLWWQEVRKAHEALATDLALEYLDKGVRLARRGWYASEMHLKAVSSWSNKKLQKVFFSLFPSAESAFTKHDELAGLSQGPSSFFLMSISEKEKPAPKKSRKIVS